MRQARPNTKSCTDTLNFYLTSVTQIFDNKQGLILNRLEFMTVTEQTLENPSSYIQHSNVCGEGFRLD